MLKRNNTLKKKQKKFKKIDEYKPIKIDLTKSQKLRQEVEKLTKEINEKMAKEISAKQESVEKLSLEHKYCNMPPSQEEQQCE